MPERPVEIAHIRCESGKYVRAPFPPAPPIDVVIGYLAQTNADLVLYPPEYAGDITPAGWKEEVGQLDSYLIKVSENGGEADISVAHNEMQAQGQSAENLHHLSPDSLQDFTYIGVQNNKNLIIGGVVLCVTTDMVDGLRRIFPEGQL
ncbi:MAG TPA: hypothetical protein VJR27_02460 [Candidatus Saccharimonadales bacterium]|nr:hypothetical protein [Candidatus Saccharimonadales bacterium]